MLNIVYLLLIFLNLRIVRPVRADISIDDSQWNTYPLQLSDGWNMARPDQVEMLNETEVSRMQEFGLTNFFNSSISWTRTERAWNMITFQGTEIEVFGVRSPQSGLFTVMLNEDEVGSGNAFSNRFETNSSIFRKADLAPGVTHNLRLVNGNGTLYFDYAIARNASAPPTASSSQAAPTGLIVASSVDAARKSSTSISPGQAVMNIGLDPAKLASLTIETNFSWNWRVYFTIAFTAFIALIAMVLILAGIRRDRKSKSRVSRSFFNSAPAAVQRLKGFKANRKSALPKPQSYPADLERCDIAKGPLKSDPSPMRVRSASLDSVTGMPKAPRQITLAEALKEDRAVGQPSGQAPRSGSSPRPLF